MNSFKFEELLAVCGAKITAFSKFKCFRQTVNIGFFKENLFLENYAQNFVENSCTSFIYCKAGLRIKERCSTICPPC